MRLEKLAPLKEQAEVLEERLEEIGSHQAERVEIIQQALDPYAVSFVQDEGGNVITGEYGFPQRIIDEQVQVNWIQTYQNSASEDNYFDIGKEKITIRLGAWNGGQVYETQYQQNDKEEWELHPDSTIYDVSFSSDEILRFKFREKDRRENETGRVFEFELQRSPFDRHVRLTGDLLISVGKKVVRRGQFRAILFRKDG